MKLNELIEAGLSRYRMIATMLRHPGDVLAQKSRQRAEETLKEIEVPFGRSTVQSEQPSVMPEQRTTTVLAPDQQPIPARRVRSSRQTEIPLLPEDKDLRGRRGKYRRVGDVTAVTERSRLYNGVLVFNGKPVLIKEYLLPERDFNSSEARDTKEAFAALTHLNLKANVGQDFRIITPLEVFAPSSSGDRCCYSINDPIPNGQTLRDYLTQDRISAKQVRLLLNQVLQSLWFLHSQRIRLPNSEVQQGIAHGNLSLDSLTIVFNGNIHDQPQFLIYLTDLALWEHLFIPVDRKPPNPSFAQDLKDLGAISIQLLNGSPQTDPEWQHDDRYLKQFVQKLLRGEFKNNAEVARQELLRLPIETLPSVVTTTETQHRVKPRLPRNLAFLLLSLLAGAGFWLVWQLWFGRSPMSVVMQPKITTFKGVQIPTGRFIYVGNNDTWKYLLKGQQLISYSRTLEQELKARSQRLATYQLITDKSQLKPDFELLSLIAPPSKDNGQVVAYDALVVFVAFSDAQRKDSIPKKLNGKITLDQLRQIYTGKLTAGEDLAESLRGWKIHPYAVDDPQALELFKQLVLKGDPQDLNQFKQLSRTQADTLDRSSYPFVLARILQEFETPQPSEKAIGIGFGLLSKVFGQCAVYPLAIDEVQPLMQRNGDPVTPETNLCKKGSYVPNPTVFNDRPLLPQYPLKYNLSVIYSPGNEAGEKFSELLTTTEGQYLLGQAGLVPLDPLPQQP